MSNVAQRSFGAGELSPSLYARTDVQRYQIGLRTCRNFLVLKHGGVANRPGMALVGTCARASLLPFVFNESQSYVLEFSERTIRIIQAGGYLPVSIVTPYLEAELAGLDITQSADVLTIVHPSHPIMELRRLAALTWTLTAAALGPSIGTPQNLFMVQGGGGFVKQWVVTAISAATGAESYPSTSAGSDMNTLAVQTRDLIWDPVAGASGYNIYESGQFGGYGFIGTSVNPSFRAGLITPDFLDQPPAVRTLFAATGDYPSAVGQFQSRRWVAGTDNSPEETWSSRTADLGNFTVSVPTQDDDAVTFRMISKKVHGIRHIVDSTGLFLFTSGGEVLIRGDGSGAIRPTDINPLNFSKHGCSELSPIVTEDAIVFVQARQSVVREIIEGEVREKYVGRDLTVYSAHLFQGHTIVSWAYQEVPNSTIWCVRDDGVLLGLTYMNDQQVLAWHRHDTDGLVESVCVIPEGGEDALYLVVNRASGRMVERMATRNFTDIRDAIFMDAALSYDGRNTSAVTMTLSGGSTWDYDNLLTVTRSTAGFGYDEAGNEVWFTAAADGLPLRIRVTNVISPSVVQGFPSRLVPSDLQNVATTSWSRAVDSFAGLGHLEGKSLAVTGDGYVVASPNNPAYADLACVVSGGSISFPQCYSYLHAGLPYLSDLETLDIDSPQGQSLKDTKIKVGDVTAYVEASRGFFAGQQFPTGSDPLELMMEAKFRDVSDDYGLITLQTDTIGVKIEAGWNSNGRAAIRNPDPVPLTVLAIIPRGHLSQAG